MANTLSEFIQHIKKNSIARMNRFRVHFALPERVSIDAGGEFVEKTISLTCLIADVPGKQNQTTDVSYGNYARKVSFGRSTGDFTTTFLVTGKYVEKRLLDAWMRVVNDESQHAVEFYDNYISSILVECLNEQDEVMYSFELTETYPLSVSNLKLDRTAQNQQMVMDVTWAYHMCNFLPPTNDVDRSGNRSSNIPPVGIPGPGAAKQRLLPIPGIDSFSSAVQNTMNTVKEFRSQLQGALNIATDVREQVRDLKMSVVDGVKTMNGVIKDVKAIKNIPTDVKNEVVDVLTSTRNQMGYLKDDLNNINNYPKR